MHFKNKRLRPIVRGLSLLHYFTIPYSLWSNVAIERFWKELFRVIHAFTLDFCLDHQEWPDILPLVQSAISHTPSSQRSGVCPFNVMTGFAASPQISTFYRSGTTEVLTVTDTNWERAMNVDKLIQLVEGLHPLVQKVLQENHCDRQIRSSKW